MYELKLNVTRVCRHQSALYEISRLYRLSRTFTIIVIRLVYQIISRGIRVHRIPS